MSENAKHFNVTELVVPNSNVYQITTRDSGFIGIVTRNDKDQMIVGGVFDNARNFEDMSGWYDVFPSLFDLFVPTPEDINKIREYLTESIKRGHNTRTCQMSLELFESFLKTQQEGKEKMKDHPRIMHGIDTPERDPAVIAEMISKVDERRLRNLFSIDASNSSTKRAVEQNIVTDYLNRWANAKYEWYLAFGRNLTIESPLEIKIESREMGNLIEALKNKWPKYAPMLCQFSTAEYMDNVIAEGKDMMRYIPAMKKGTAISKFLSQLYDDGDFDLEVSKLLQNRMLKGGIVISIDPYDYMTQSINAHGWQSCHRIDEGQYAAGCLSYMGDQSTLIAYRTNGRVYQYDYYGFKFEGNSKSWRQMVYADKKTLAAIFSRNYPGDITECQELTRKLWRETMSKYCGFENVWIRSNEVPATMRSGSTAVYLDASAGSHWPYIRPKYLDSRLTPSFQPGSQATCLYCGTPISGSRNGRAVCGCR